MATDFIGFTFGSYKLVEIIGRGGMASVFRGYQESIDRSVAVKVLPPEFLHDPNFSERFTAEARLLAKLTHPAILPLYDFGTAHDVPYIVMPLMTGGTLADYIKHGPLSVNQLIRLFSPLADALDFAHSMGVVHRDIKPSNILFDQRRQPFLADFGIAKAIQASSNLTGTGIIGTPDYMSPEQARGEQMDGRSDLYSFAVMAYQCLTADLLFKATTPIGVMLMHATEPPPPIRQKRSDISAAVEAVLNKALSKQPRDRYQTTVEFVQALAAAAGPQATQTAPLPQPTMQPTLAPNTGRVDRPTGAMPPPTGSVPPSTGTVRPATSSALPPAQATGVFGGAILGGGVGLVIGIVVVVGLIIACCLGVYVMTPQATPTPKPTATTVPTPVPTAVSYLFYDDFSNANSGWEYGKGDVSDIEYENGEYSELVTQTGWFVWGNPPKQDYSNISTQVNARYVNGSYNNILFGVMCNFQDNQHYYYAGIGADGYYGIGKRDGNTDTILTGNGQLAKSNDLAQGGSWFRLNVDCAADGTLTLYVDGTQIATAKDTKFTHGNIGLFTDVYSPSTGDPNQPIIVEVHFDDLTVTQLP